MAATASWAGLPNGCLFQVGVAVGAAHHVWSVLRRWQTAHAFYTTTPSSRTREMRKDLMANLTVEWEAALEARLAMCSTSPVAALNTLLRDCLTTSR
jgi:hypothetical protein